MKICCKISTLLLLCCCWVMLSTSANAKVCFAGDPGCGGIDSFGSYQDPDAKIADQCALAGYDVKREDCKADNGMQPTENCPYDSNYVKCCSLEYAYDACVYPMVQAGKCGNKYKCVCDTKKYKYTANGSSTDCKNNSYASGASCAQVTYNTETKQSGTSIYFTDCRCDKAAYPTLESQCDADADRGDKCVSIDNNGNTETRYSYCSCNTAVYPETQNSCDNPDEDKFGPSVVGGYCDDGIRHYKTCVHCSSNGYVAENLDHVSGEKCSPYTGEVKKATRLIGYSFCPGELEKIDSKIEDDDTPDIKLFSSKATIGVVGGGTAIKKCLKYETYYTTADGNMELTRMEVAEGQYIYLLAGQESTCGYLKCPNGSRYRHLKCAPGYEAKDGVCTLMGCKDAIRAFTKKYTDYVLLDDSYSNVNATTVIVAPGVTSVSLSSSCGAKTYTKCTSCSCRSVSSDASQCYTDLNDTSACYNACRDSNVRVDQPITGGNGEDGFGKNNTVAGRYDTISERKVECCTNYTIFKVGVSDRGLNCTASRNYISVKSLSVDDIDSDLASAMKLACGSGESSIQLTSGTFPHDAAEETSSGSGDITLTDVNLLFGNGKTTVTRKLMMKGGDLYIGGTSSSTIAFQKDVTLNNLSSNDTAKVYGNGVISIQGAGAKWDSTGYDYDINRLDVEGLVNPLFIKGTSSKRISFKANRLMLSWNAMFNYTNVWSKITCVGCSFNSDGSVKSSPVTLRVGIDLYNTDWYMYGPDGTYFTAYLTVGSYIGNDFYARYFNDSSWSDSYTSSGGTSKIRYQDNTSAPFVSNPAQYKYCSRCAQGYAYKSDGTLVDHHSDSGCSRWCQSSKKSTDYSDARVCYIKGNKSYGGAAGDRTGWIELGGLGRGVC